MKKMFFYFGLIICLLLSACAANNIPAYEEMTIDDQILSEEEMADVRNYLQQANSINFSLIDEPDYTIVAKKKNGYHDYYSIYLKEKVIFPNDSFYASFDNLSRRKSKCYQIDADIIWLFKDLNPN
jgi:hypothetical protein